MAIYLWIQILSSRIQINDFSSLANQWFTSHPRLNIICTQECYICIFWIQWLVFSFTKYSIYTKWGQQSALMKDGGWCTYNSTTIQRFDTNGQLKWQESVTLAHLGIQLIVEQSNGSLLTSGTYLYQDCSTMNTTFHLSLGTIDTLGKKHHGFNLSGYWPMEMTMGIRFGISFTLLWLKDLLVQSRIDTSSIFLEFYFLCWWHCYKFPTVFAIGWITNNVMQCPLELSIQLTWSGFRWLFVHVQFNNYSMENQQSLMSINLKAYFLFQFNSGQRTGECRRFDSVAIVIWWKWRQSLIQFSVLLFHSSTTGVLPGAVYNYNAEIRNSQLGFSKRSTIYHRDNWNPFVCFMACKKIYKMHICTWYHRIYGIIYRHINWVKAWISIL